MLEIFRFRKRLFVDIEKWDLPTDGPFEIDQFDHEMAKYIVIFHCDKLVGGFRAIRTTDPYLASAVFPDLAQTIPYPKKHDAWEISRFGVIPRDNPRDRIVAAKFNYSMMFRFANMYRATSLVAIADLQYERFLRKLGVRSRRFGPPQVVGKTTDGKCLELVAGEIPITDQSGPRFDQIVNLSAQMEINDETTILGREAISA